MGIFVEQEGNVSYQNKNIHLAKRKKLEA